MNTTSCCMPDRDADVDVLDVDVDVDVDVARVSIFHVT